VPQLVKVKQEKGEAMMELEKGEGGESTAREV
jgi:hypothetical protein